MIVRHPNALALVKRLTVAPVLVLSLLMTACQSQPLAWIDDANAERMVMQDSAQGKYRFLSVCGYSCNVPGVGSMNAKMCFPQTPVQIIEGTSDVFGSDEEARLNGKARTVAEQYNLLMATHLQRGKQSKCDVNANWDGGFTALHRYVESLNDNVREAGYVAFIAERSLFNVVLPANVTSGQVSAGLCERVTEHGLRLVAVVKLLHRGEPEGAATLLHCPVKDGQTT